MFEVDVKNVMEEEGREGEDQARYMTIVPPLIQ